MVVTVYEFEDFKLDCDRFELYRAGRSLKLERMPMELLILLATRNGHLVTRTEIAERLWSREVFVDTEHGINTAIRKIRQVLRDDPEQPRFVQTVTGKGYRFIAPLTEIKESAGNGNGSVGVVLPVEAPRPSNPEKRFSNSSNQVQPPAMHPRRRSPIMIAMAASIGVVVVLGLAWFFRSPLPAPKIARVDQLTSDGVDKFPWIGTDGSRVYFTEEAQGHFWVAAVSASGGAVVPIRVPFRESHFIAVSPDKAELLVSEGSFFEDRPLWLVPLLGGSPHRVGNIAAHDAKWSPDGQKLAFVTYGAVKGGALSVASGDGSDPHQLYVDSGKSVFSPTWSPDGSHLRFDLGDLVENTSTLWEIDASGKNLHPVLPGWQTTPMQCCGAWAEGGKYYLFDAWNEINGAPAPTANLWIIREKKGLLQKTNPRPVQLTAGPVHFFTHAVSPDGKTIFAVSTEENTELMRYDTQAKRFSTFGSGLSADSVTFSRDGKWMAYVKYPQGELWRSKIDGTEALQLTLRPFVAYAPQWAPDGKQIAFWGQKAGTGFQSFVVPADGGQVQELLPQPVAGVDATWSPDGNSVLFGTKDADAHSNLRIVNLRTHEISTVPGSEGLYSPRWSPDGRYISALTAVNRSLMLFDSTTRKWRVQIESPPASDWQIWSRNGKYIYFLRDMNNNSAIFRVSVENDKVERIVDLQGFHSADLFGMWFSLTPNDEPLLLRQLGGAEIYALHWETALR